MTDSGRVPHVERDTLVGTCLCRTAHRQRSARGVMLVAAVRRRIAILTRGPLTVCALVHKAIGHSISGDEASALT